MAILAQCYLNNDIRLSTYQCIHGPDMKVQIETCHIVLSFSSGE